MNKYNKFLYQTEDLLYNTFRLIVTEINFLGLY